MYVCVFTQQQQQQQRLSYLFLPSKELISISSLKVGHNQLGTARLQQSNGQDGHALVYPRVECEM